MQGWKWSDQSAAIAPEDCITETVGNDFTYVSISADTHDPRHYQFTSPIDWYISTASTTCPAARTALAASRHGLFRHAYDHHLRSTESGPHLAGGITISLGHYRGNERRHPRIRSYKAGLRLLLRVVVLGIARAHRGLQHALATRCHVHLCYIIPVTGFGLSRCYALV